VNKREDSAVLRILLAEDNPGDVFLVRRALEEHNISHELNVVQDGAEALEFIARMGQTEELPCPDVVLLDLNLPKVDGPRVLAALRKHPECLAIPVIVITSSDAQKDRARMEELRVAWYFRKPSHYRAFLQLGAVVREVAQGSAAAPVADS
jgi:chemotaxis family two-component system response regulator Rcp1